MAKEQKTVIDVLGDVLGQEAVAQVAEITKARIDQGDNPDYHRRAKLAIGVIGNYVRLCATRENARTNDLITLRTIGEGDEKAKQARLRLLRGVSVE